MNREQRRRFLLALLVGALVLAGVTITSRWSAILCTLRPAPAYTPQPPAPTCAPQPLAPTYTPQPLAPTCAVQPLASTYVSQPLGSLVQYSDDGLGFAVQVPCGWEIARSQELQGIAGFRGAVEFRSGLYLGGAQALGSYWVSVGVSEARFGTLTETVEYDLSQIVLPEIRNTIKQRCCFLVGGEPAMELTGFPYERWGGRKLLVFHNGLQYWLSFRPYGMQFDTPSDLAAQEGFDLFLRTFTFIPVTPYPLVPWSPVPTPPQ